MGSRRRPPLQVQLPVAAAMLFSMLAVVLLLIAFVRIRQQSLDLASSRLIRLVDQLAGSVGQSAPTLIRSARAAAADSLVRSAVLGRRDLDTVALNRLLRPLIGGEADNSVLAIWDTGGHRLYTVHAPAAVAPWIGPPAAVDSAVLSPITSLGDTLLYYELIAPVRIDGERRGYLQRRSRVSSNDGTRQLVATLLGDSGTLLFGSAGGPWTDLRGVVSPPDSAVMGASEAIPYRREGSERLGVGRAVGGTAWLVVAELPVRAVVAPSRQFLVQLAAVALLLVLVSTVLAWLLGRGITAPLRSLAETAAAIRQGDFTRRATLRGHSELVTVNEAFNAMADDSARHIQALHVNEERLRSLVDASAELIWWAGPDGLVHGPAPSWQAFTGQTSAEVQGLGWLDAVHPDDADEVRRQWQEAIGTGREFEAEHRVRHRDGTWRIVRSRATPVLAADGSIQEWVRISTDVSDTRRVERQLARKEQELIQAQRLDSIGRLAGGVAHDFNNILTAIVVPAELALEQVSADSPLRADLEEIRDAARRATELTRQLLAFGRQQVLAPEVVEFDAVVESAGRIAKRLIPESITMEFKLQGGRRRVEVDPTQLEQVVLNLAVNARDAMRDGGHLEIATEVQELGVDDAERHEGVTPGRYLMLSVTDTGSGMDAATQERIFDPFFTTKDKGHGTGLGLATVYGIVHQSGGHIWLYSEPGNGTVVRVFIPEAAADRATEEARMAVAAPAGTGTILFAEDDPALRRIGERMLHKLGYDVLVAPDGATALELAGQHAGTVDLLVTDMVMPGMSGMDLADALHRQWPDLPVLFLSGWTGDQVIRQRIAAGETPFLQKPFTTESLGRKVHEVLASRRSGR